MFWGIEQRNPAPHILYGEGLDSRGRLRYKRPVSAENVRHDTPPAVTTAGGFERVAGVEGRPPGVHTPPPATHPKGVPVNKCATCGGWVNPLERIYTDEAMYHDRLACLTEGSFEALVAKYACRCVDVGAGLEAPLSGDGVIRSDPPAPTTQEYHDHQDEEHAERFHAEEWGFGDHFVAGYVEEF